MVDGIKAGAEGMRLLTLRLDTLAANLANASTAGYKKDELAAAVLPEEAGGGIKTESYTDLSQGGLLKTGSPFDLALEGDGFFAAGEGDKAAYTRDGRLSLDPSGRLTAAGGLPLLGRGGPIVLNPALETVIGSDGSVSQGGSFVDRIKIVRFEDPGALEKAGGGLFKSAAEGRESQAAVRQGFVENSNVKLMEEVASMMQVMRNFEQIQKAMTSQDAATGKMIAAFGRY